MRSPDTGGGGRGELKSDINVTPLIGVFLVLLSIAVILQPVVHPARSIKLPRAANTVDKPNPDRPELTGHELTVVGIMSVRRIYVNGYPVHQEELTQKVIESLESKKDKAVLIKADEDAPYSAVMAVMDRLRAAHIENVTFLVEKRSNGPGGAEEGR